MSPTLLPPERLGLDDVSLDPVEWKDGMPAFSTGQICVEANRIRQDHYERRKWETLLFGGGAVIAALNLGLVLYLRPYLVAAAAEYGFLKLELLYGAIGLGLFLCSGAAAISWRDRYLSVDEAVRRAVPELTVRAAIDREEGQ